MARAWRAHVWEREIVLRAAGTTDPNGRELAFDWVILRGDPARIRIAWHDAYPAPGAPDLATSRIDIGIFARNGHTVSAPSFLSVVFPVHQRRVYAPAPGGGRRLVEIGYAGRGGAVDPALWSSAGWRDVYSYPNGHALARVTRRYDDGGEAALVQEIGGLAATALDGTLRRVTHVPFRDGRGVPRLRDDLQPGP